MAAKKKVQDVKILCAEITSIEEALQILLTLLHNGNIHIQNIYEQNKCRLEAALDNHERTLEELVEG